MLIIMLSRELWIISECSIAWNDLGCKDMDFFRNMQESDIKKEVCCIFCRPLRGNWLRITIILCYANTRRCLGLADHYDCLNHLVCVQHLSSMT